MKKSKAPKGYLSGVEDVSPGINQPGYPGCKGTFFGIRGAFQGAYGSPVTCRNAPVMSAGALACNGASIYEKSGRSQLYGKVSE